MARDPQQQRHPESWGDHFFFWDAGFFIFSRRIHASPQKMQKSFVVGCCLLLPAAIVILLEHDRGVEKQ